jgi:hypothetical protein
VAEDSVLFSDPLPVTPGDLAWKELTLPGPFHPDSALHRLYPGRFMKNAYDDMPDFVLWKCEECEVKSHDGWFIGEPQFFPNPQGMETDVIRHYRYFENGKEQITVFFSSHDIRYGDPGSGRFTCAFLGAALFEKEGDSWKLEAFHPGMDCTGNYSEARSPDTLRVGNKMFFALEDANGGPGSPYLGKCSLFGFHGKTFRRLLQITDGSMGGYRHEWNTTFNFMPGSGENPPIVAVTSGTYDDQTLNDLEGYDLSPGLNNILKQQKYNTFTLTRTYRYSGGKYILSNEKSDLSLQKEK